MRILVSGGAGFIGSHIVDAYVRRGHRVAVVDDLSTGKRAHIHPRARLFRADIRRRKLIDGIFKKFRPEAVNHHAAITSVVRSVREPEITHQVNVEGTINLLRAASAYGTRRFLFASTGGTIYGEGGARAVREDAPLAPVSPYALSKLLGEECIRFASRTTPQLTHIIFRYANVFGPRQDPKGEAGVVAIFGLAMAGNTTPTIFGNGHKVRDYVHIDDVVRANVHGLSRGANTVINIGTGRGIQDIDVFRTVARALGYAFPPRYAPFRAGEIQRITLNARRAARVLAWQPTISFASGVRDTLRLLTPRGWHADAYRHS